MQPSRRCRSPGSTKPRWPTGSFATFQSLRARERAAREPTGVCLLQLHLVGADPQSQALLLSDRTDGRGGRFWVRVDEGLARQVARALARATEHAEGPDGAGEVDGAGGDTGGPGGDDGAGEVALGPERNLGGTRGGPVPGPPSPRAATFDELVRTGGGYRGALSPREIQARLRQGRTVEEVADEAGVETEWVERFAGPIFAERRAALGRAVSLRSVSTTGAVSVLPLAEAVARNLARRGFGVDRVGLAGHWSASHLQGDQWTVQLSFSDGHKEVRAEWTADLAEGRLSPGSPLSAQLAFVEAPPGDAGGGDPPVAPSPPGC